MTTATSRLIGRANGAVAGHGKGLVGRVNAIAIDADGWIDLLWEGEWNHPEGAEAVDRKDIELTLANLRQRAQGDGANWAGIPVYIGHPEKEPNGVAAPAVAWVKDFRIDAKTGRLQGRPEWCGEARKELVESGQYKYLSCYEWGDTDPTTGVFHTATISSIGLTNFPVKRAGQKPLANAEAGEGGAAGAAGEGAGDAAAGDAAADEGTGDPPAPSGRAQGASADLAAMGREIEAIRTLVNGLAATVGVAGDLAAVVGRVNAMAAELQELRTAAAGRLQAGCDPLAGAAPVRVTTLGEPTARAQAGPADTAAVGEQVRARAQALLSASGGNWERAWAQAMTEAAAQGRAAAAQ